MCSNERNILRLDCDGEIVEMYLPAAEVKRAESDLVYAQKLFNSYQSRKENCEVVNDISEVEHNEHEEASTSRNADVFWSEAETLLFISLYENHKEDFLHAKKRKYVWRTIEEQMAAHNYFRSADKLERKWTNLMRVYRAIKDNKGPNKSGRGAQNYKFYERINEVVGDKPSNNLQSTTVVDVGVTKENITPARDSEDSLDSEEKSAGTENNAEPIHSPKRRKQNQSLLLRREKLLDKAKRHAEIMELERKKLQMEQKKIDLLETILQKIA